MTQKQKEKMIDDYFNDPMVKSLMERELGKFGKVTVDWKANTVLAAGSKAAKQWDLDEMLVSLGSLARMNVNKNIH